MRMAVIADVHSNLPALQATLAAIEDAGVRRIVSLGDVVGYNAQPVETIRMLQAHVDTFIAGNHDLDCVSQGASPGTSALARDVQAWTRAQLDEAAIEFLRSQAALHADADGFVAAHGCYLNATHVTGYVTGTMLPENLQAIRNHPTWPKVALCGHTHVGMVGWLQSGATEEPEPKGQVRWPAGAEAVLINPGSVGQPRDGDTRAAFAIVDLARNSVEFMRVPYDIESACAAILAAGLPEHLADRLREGR